MCVSDGSRDDLLLGWSAGGTENIDRLFDEAGRSIGEGFHVEFWQWVVRGIDDVAKIRHSKIEVAVLLSDPTVVTGLLAAGRSLPSCSEWSDFFKATVVRP